MKIGKSDYLIFKDAFLIECTNFSYGDMLDDEALLEFCYKLKLKESPEMLTIQHWIRGLTSMLGKINFVFSRVRGKGYQILEPHEILPHIKKKTAHKVVKEFRSAKKTLGYCDVNLLSLEQRNMLIRSKSNFGTLASIVESGLRGNLIHNDSAAKLIDETSRQLKLLEQLTSND